jgi:uncharacterized protein
MSQIGPPAGSADQLERLIGLLRGLDRVLVAFSGGVDSSCLLAAAAGALPGRVHAVTAATAAHPRGDHEAAIRVLAAVAVPHTTLEVDTLALEPVRTNARDRCYHCKLALLGAMQELAHNKGLGVLIEGTNADDLGTHRPGLAALATLGVRSPLAELGLGKAEVRAMAARLGLEVADRPSSACLLTRLPYGVEVTPERLERIDRAEALLRSLGVGQLRVRDHHPVARIEVEPADLGLVLHHREQIRAALQELGWRHVTLDLGGYQSGSYDGPAPDAGGQVHERTTA